MPKKDTRFRTFVKEYLKKNIQQLQIFFAFMLYTVIGLWNNWFFAIIPVAGFLYVIAWIIRDNYIKWTKENE